MSDGLPEYVTVAMGITPDGGHKVLAVDDTGTGIPSPLIATDDVGAEKIRAVAQTAHDMLGVAITIGRYRLTSAQHLDEKKPEGI